MTLSNAFNKVAGATLTQKFRRIVAAVVFVVAVPVSIHLYNTSVPQKTDNTHETEPKKHTGKHKDKYGVPPQNNNNNSVQVPEIQQQTAGSICLEGCPLGAPSSNRVIERPIFVLSNNGQTKFADWVAYVVTRDSIGTETKNRSWHRDRSLPKNETLSAKDYEGAREALSIDRGHQAPLASLAGRSDWKEANDLSNITPQSVELNEGSWERLEEAERKLARAGVTVHSVTGPLYERDMPKLPHAHLDHKVPSGYWKVVAVGEGENIQVAAFILDQNLHRDAKFCDNAVAVRTVEVRAKLNMFPNLKQSVQDNIESAPGKLLGKMGCRP